MSTNPTEPLSLKQVIGRWGNIKKRVRQKSTLKAAYLNHCQIVGLIEAPKSPVILIQAAHPRHYTILITQGLQEIEWAFSMELNKPCIIRLLPPDAMPPLSNNNENQEPGPAGDTKILTKQLVVSVWESIKQQIRKTIPLVAVYMEHCHVVDIQESPNGPLVLLQTETQQIFESLKAYNRFRDIEAALTQELGIACSVKLIPPNTEAV